ncbi:hypothetical protein [Longivirga aurantiaca]|uniref:Uncharacterized protein n=1 Tax=Longivirga aurantiaca TaxID=1837743 RepID=A0ABW1T2D9_9ACTN
MSPASGAVLDSLLEEAATALGCLAGGAAVCAFSRAGVPVPGITYAEGRWAALRDVQRATSYGAAVETASAAALVTWEAELESAVARGAGCDWVAYRTGGVDALGALLDRPASARPSG